MDRPQPVSEELEITLRQLEFVNRYFGGHRLVRHFLRRWFAAGGHAHVLDLATGGGDYPRMMVSWARKSGVKLHVEAVDASPSILRIASSMSTRFPEISFTRGDALSFGEMRKYDLVHCSLALHHFSDGDAVRLLRRCRDLSRRYVIVTDLERSCTTRVAVRTANVLLGHSRMTREDGDTSARRAFSFREAHALAERAGWMDFSHGRFLFCRQALWMDLQA